MLQKSKIKDGQFILIEGKIGIIQNVGNAIETGRRRKGMQSNPEDELGYDILYITNYTKRIFKDVCEHSGTTHKAVALSKKDASKLLKQAFRQIDIDILEQEKTALENKISMLKIKEEIAKRI